MQTLTIMYGLTLSLLGIGSYAVSDTKSITALIPLFFGVPVILCGFIAKNEKIKMHVMHVVVLLALVGFVGSFSGLTQLPVLLSGASLERPLVVASKGIMSITSLVFLIFCIRSFIDARRARAS